MTQNCQTAIFDVVVQNGLRFSFCPRPRFLVSRVGRGRGGRGGGEGERRRKGRGVEEGGRFWPAGLHFQLALRNKHQFVWGEGINSSSKEDSEAIWCMHTVPCVHAVRWPHRVSTRWQAEPPPERTVHVPSSCSCPGRKGAFWPTQIEQTRPRNY